MSASPTARTLARLRKEGVAADVVEKWNPHAHRKKDVANVIDVVAYGPKVGILGIQTTTGDHHADRRAKAMSEPLLWHWLLGGGRFEVWSWSKLANGRWTLRRERVLVSGTDLVAVEA